MNKDKPRTLPNVKKKTQQRCGEQLKMSLSHNVVHKDKTFLIFYAAYLNVMIVG